MQKMTESESNKMKGGVIPSPGSHGSATRQPRSMTKDETGTVHTRETSHTTTSIPRVIVSGLYLWNICFGAVRVRSGSSGTCGRRGSSRSVEVHGATVGVLGVSE